MYETIERNAHCLPCVRVFDEVALATREYCRGSENVAHGDFGVGYAPVYIFQNSSNPTLKMCASYCM